MADKGIIFSAPMVRALLDGRKTQTRRLIAGAPNGGNWHCDPDARAPGGRRFVAEGGSPSLPCKVPYAPGDRLYVREAAWICPAGWTDSPVNPMGPHRREVAYAADDRTGYTSEAAADYNLRLSPSIHMPRWASRLWLAVTEVRVQRLQEISEADAITEGIERHPEYSTMWRRGHLKGDQNTVTCTAFPFLAFRSIWEALHTDPGTRWEDNPWIVAVSFVVHHGNIDTVAA